MSSRTSVGKKSTESPGQMSSDTDNMITVSLVFTNLCWYCENIQLQKFYQIKKRAVLADFIFFLSKIIEKKMRWFWNFAQSRVLVMSETEHEPLQHANLLMTSWINVSQYLLGFEPISDQCSHFISPENSKSYRTTKGYKTGALARNGPLYNPIKERNYHKKELIYTQSSKWSKRTSTNNDKRNLCEIKIIV